MLGLKRCFLLHCPTWKEICEKLLGYSFVVQALEKEPDNAQVLASRAEAHLRLENFMEASEDAGKAVELTPDMPRAHLRKGYELLAAT